MVSNPTPTPSPLRKGRGEKLFAGCKAVDDTEAEDFLELPVAPVIMVGMRLVVSQVGENLGVEVARDGEIESVLPITLHILVVGKHIETRRPGDAGVDFPEPLGLDVATECALGVVPRVVLDLCDHLRFFLDVDLFSFDDWF